MSTTEELFLSFDPFEGDRDFDCRTLGDAFVNARKPHICSWCFGPIAPGERVRALRQRAEEFGVATFRFCAKCCAAGATVWEDETPFHERLGSEAAQ